MWKYAKIHLSHTTVHLLRPHLLHYLSPRWDPRTLPSQKVVPLLHAPSIEYWQPECDQNYRVDPQSALGASGTLDNFAYPFLALPGSTVFLHSQHTPLNSVRQNRLGKYKENK